MSNELLGALLFIIPFKALKQAYLDRMFFASLLQLRRLTMVLMWSDVR